MERDLDKELYNQYLNGEKEAFEILYNKYKEKLQYFICNIVKDYQKAEDLMQETFIYVMGSKIKQECSFKTYIYMVAKSKAFNYQNVENRRKEISDIYLTSENEKDVLDIMTKEDSKRELLEAIEMLEEKYRNAIYLNFIEELTYEETACILGETLSNTKNLIHRGKRKLRIILLKKGFDEMSKVLKIAIILLCTVTVLSGVTYAVRKWNIEFKKSETSVESPNDAITSAKETGYIDEFSNDYMVKDGIGIKVDSLLLTDDCLELMVDFKFSEEKEVNSDSFEFGYAIYDENKNIYRVAPRWYLESAKHKTEKDEMIEFSKKIGLKYDENNILDKMLSDNATIEHIEVAENRTMKKSIILKAKDKFPNSKKIYVKFFDLGYFMIDKVEGSSDSDDLDAEDFDITDKEWIFELNVSDKMIERETIELTLKDEIPKINIQKCTLTESGLLIVFNSNEQIEYIGMGKNIENIKNGLDITDKDGRYYQYIESDITENGTYKASFDIPKKDFENGLFVKYRDGEREYVSELIQK